MKQVDQEYAIHVILVSANSLLILFSALYYQSYIQDVLHHPLRIIAFLLISISTIYVHSRVRFNPGVVPKCQDNTEKPLITTVNHYCDKCNIIQVCASNTANSH